MIESSVQRLGRSQFARFLLVGGLAAGVNVVARYVFDLFTGYSLAIVLAYLCGMGTAFLLSKRFVFEPSGLQTATELARFGLVNLAAVAQVWAVSVGLAEWLFPLTGLNTYRYDIAHLIGVAVPVVTSYFGHKYFSFSGPVA